MMASVLDYMVRSLARAGLVRMIPLQFRAIDHVLLADVVPVWAVNLKPLFSRRYVYEHGDRADMVMNAGFALEHPDFGGLFVPIFRDSFVIRSGDTIEVIVNRGSPLVEVSDI